MNYLVKLLILILLFPYIPDFVKAQNIQEIKDQAITEIDQLEPDIHTMCQELWDLSETALKEQKSAGLMVNSLQEEGFTIESGVAGMPTAFIASYGKGKPVIGILAEFDALPGTGNAPVPYKQAREDGMTAGQGCGHNLFGSAAVNAAIALRRLMEKHDIPGTVKLYGTPAEETVVGKVFMAKAGLFNDLDAALDWHPGTKTGVKFRSSLAMNNFEVEFFGQAAHGAGDPWNGRSALDAVEMMNYGVNLMREHVYPTTRIHYVIPNGGEAPNVVPEYAKVWYYVRDTSRSNVEKYYNRILKIAEGAALGTNTTHKVRLITAVHEYLINYPIMKMMEDNLKIVGAPKFTEKEQEWAMKLQESTGKEQKGFNTEIEFFPEDWKEAPITGGSTDVAEVSYITPTAGFRVATAPEEVPWHSWATTASHGTEAAFKGAVVAAKVLTLTGLDLLLNDKLLNEARKYFIDSTGDHPYQSPVPEDLKVILPE